MKWLKSVVAIVLLSGCTLYGPGLTPDVVEPVRIYAPPSAAYSLPDPPSPYESKYDMRTNDGMIEYATAVNWYLYQVYNYTYVLNKVAITKGWMPPDIEPLCLTLPWPKMVVIPDIKFTEIEVRKFSVEWSLTEYIKRTRSMYDEQRTVFEKFEIWQRKMCNF